MIKEIFEWKLIYTILMVIWKLKRFLIEFQKLKDFLNT